MVNPADKLCYPCASTVANCVTCSSYGVCQTCDYTNNYYATNGGTVCSLCNGVNMFINTTNPLYPCVLCSPTHCLNCLTINQCSVCDTTNGYFLNPADQQCYACSTTIPNCQTCSSYNICQTCNYASNYYLNSATVCNLCNSAVNMFIDTTDPTYPCVLCSPSNCATCASIS